jgi:hypothetical protein
MTPALMDERRMKRMDTIPTQLSAAPVKEMRSARARHPLAGVFLPKITEITIFLFTYFPCVFFIKLMSISFHVIVSN